MDKNQNIERFFQEKFKDFEANPNPEVWKAIEAKLKKKKRKVIPIWWFSGGIAATIVLGLLLYPFLNNQEDKNEAEFPVIVDTKKEKDTNNFDKVLPNNEEKEHQKIVNSEYIKKKLKEKPLEKSDKESKKVLTANHVVKISKKNEHGKNNDVTSKVVEGSLQVNHHVVKEKKETGKPENSLPVKKNTEENALEKIEKKEILKKKKDLIAEVNSQEKEEKKEKKDKWSVAPVFAVISNNSFSKVSPLDEKLITSPTNGSNSIAYGVRLAYQLSSKWEIQSGVHIQKYNYTNTDVPITTSFVGQSLSTVDYANNGLSSFSFGTAGASFGISSTGLGPINEDATLTHEVGYIEIPLEIKYTFLNTGTFSSKIVTGFSSLFLNRNEVSVSSERISETFGSVNNLNTVDFSGNFGVEFDYNITKELKLNLNPMFKVQLNTFSSNNSGFRPYSLGLYSGIKYQF
ncbi:Outer membrane protein with beta-barrel domain [Tenacibaculum sp. 190130A14a]|uniref:Outer membrane protein with beta-barrel domain n=1 Tax=Tenacibaculum polynesiense TaxID=3137857 RepID=A0ABP1EUW4_9FLAO